MSFGQRDSYERDSLGRLILKSSKYDVTNLNNKDFYKHAQDLIKSKEKDSLFDAHTILRKLYFFDSSVYSKQLVNSYFSQIEAINLDYYKKKIIGTWVFQWAGSNWGTSETSKTKNERIIFSQNEAFFFKDEKLFRQTQYYITNSFSTLSKELFFQVYFLDDNSAKDISFRTKGADYTAKLKFGGANIGLYLGYLFSCNDCGNKIYIAEGATDYSLGK